MRSNSLLFFLSILLPASLLAQQPQEHLDGLSSRPANEIPESLPRKKSMVVYLPFFDDFSYNSHQPDPQLWEGASVFVNQTMPINPPTLGVATLDGLDRYGLAYDLTQLKRVTNTDTLSSRSIDLSNAVDSVYLSFFFQAGGHGEAPEFNDSLVVEFFYPNDTSWNRAWSTRQSQAGDFEQVLIAVPDSFHSSNFRFRFRNFGSPAGSYDNWHIDYVRLNDRRNFQDTAFTDLAFTAPHPSLLVEYTAIPYFHYNNVVSQNFKSALTFNYRRNLAPNNTLNPNLGVYRISYNGNVLAEDLNGSPGLDPNRPDNAPSSYVLDNLSYGFSPDQSAPFQLEAFQSYNLASTNRSSNDTLRYTQKFENYYAYDDGSAERSYYVTGNQNGFILSRYQFLQADSLRGLFLYFLPTHYDAEDQTFSIVVYEDLGGQPGQLIYESDSVYTPDYSQRDAYRAYALEKAVQLNQNVFIGIRQLGRNPITIGYDANNISLSVGEIFFGTATNYFQAGVGGSLMLRPYFRFNPADIGLAEKHSVLPVKVYPNPVRDVLHFAIEEAGDYQYQLMDLQGRNVQSGSVQQSIALGDWIPTGIYILRVTAQSGKFAPFTTKILID